MRRGAGGGVGLPLPSTTQLIRSLRIFLERLALLPYTWTKLDSSKVCGRTHVKGKTWRYLVPALLCPPVCQCSLSDGDDLSPFCKERTDELLSRSGGPFCLFLTRKTKRSEVPSETFTDPQHRLAFGIWTILGYLPNVVDLHHLCQGHREHKITTNSLLTQSCKFPWD